MFSNLKKGKIIPRLFDRACAPCVIFDENGKRLKTDQIETKKYMNKLIRLGTYNVVTKIKCLHCLQPFVAVLEGLTSQSLVCG